ncbi:WD40 repeat domain-containing protein [Streptomyces sp. NPDC002812]|uniref:WD40 repeat domain-containing protein n=1 Tax=Streptomyces sp. NPDC002812 TaxID=3154434 RepID=UPI00332E863B
MPAGARTLPLGSAEGCRGHQVRSFGFPAQAPPEGHFGFGVAGDLLPGSRGRSAHLQLTSANDLTTGFSGGPPVRSALAVATGMSLATPFRHADSVSSVAFSPDGGTLASASADRTVELRDVLFTRPLEAIRKICRTVKRDFTPDERKTYLPHDSGRVCPTSDGGS